MKVPTHVFREYDIRGVADRDLTSDLATAIGRGLAKLLRVEGRAARIAVGRDCRLSSPRLFEALTAGLTRGGANVVEIGVGPTPFLYGSVHALDADGGVMITGSHNPGDENGFKIMKGKASFFGADIQALRELIEKDAFTDESPRSGANAKPGSIERVNLEEKYIEMVTSKIKLAKTDMKFVVDAGNGAGGPLALACMKKLGLSPDPLFCEMDGNFPNHHPDPTVPKNVEALIARVKKTGARVGIAYDGDADRLGAVDANGDIIWGDKLMILFSRALLAEKPGAAILGEVKCSQTLYDDIAKHGGRPIMWKTGHSLIKTKMKEEHASLAGEMSGHLFFADRYFGYDDAIYASLRLLEIIAQDPRSIGEMLHDVPVTYTTPELRVDCPDAIKFDVVKAITARYKAAGNTVVDIDGARIDFRKKGDVSARSGASSTPAWGLVRASNTGPVLVMRFEAGSESERDRLRAEVEKAVTEERAKKK
jgi:phosphomannomutase/phosphoglucomutase